MCQRIDSKVLTSSLPKVIMTRVKVSLGNGSWNLARVRKNEWLTL